MSTLHQASRALQTRFGLAFLASLALVNGCVWTDAADEPEQSEEPSTGEAADALDSAAPVGIHRCTRAGGLVAGSLVVHPGYQGRTTCSISHELPGSSKLFCVGSAPFTTCAECTDLRSYFTCPIFLDPSGK
jgi:hypothetical protein